MARKQAKQADDFAALLADVKGRIQTAQTQAVLAVNAQLVRLYWDIGHIIDQRQQREGWGAAVAPRLSSNFATTRCEIARDLKNATGGGEITRLGRRKGGEE